MTAIVEDFGDRAKRNFDFKPYNTHNMKKLLLVIAFAGLFLTSCNNTTKNGNEGAMNETGDVSYTVLNNYFVNNTFTELDNPKIETQAKFDEVFGMATTMGPDGTPTPVDFSKQNVIAIVVPETNMETTITPLSLKRDDGNLKLTFRKTQGQQQSFTTRPFIAIAIDKSEKGDVVLEKVE